MHGFSADTAADAPHFTLHVATLDDAEALSQFYQDAWEDAAETPERLRAWLEQGGVLSYLVDGEFVCALRWRETPTGWEIGRLATLKAFRGQGLGRWLATRLEALAIQYNIPELALTLEPLQQDLLPYYQRMGYLARDAGKPLELHKRVGGMWQRQA